MFVFLALVFGVGFVAFGVGSDVPGGVADIIGVGGGTGQPSVSDARERVRERPDDAAGYRELATALQTAGKPEEAIQPLSRYTELRPRDEDALRELAGLYLTKAARLREEAEVAQAEAQALNPGADFLPPSTTPLGQALSNAPITQAVSTGTSERLNTAYAALQEAHGQAKTTYQRIAKLAPDDPSVQIQLADAALNAGDAPTAIAAYKRFLQLAPDDPSAPLVREELKRLEGSTPGGAGTGG